MTFVKGEKLASECGKKSVAARKKRKEDLWAYMASGGIRHYHEKMEKLKDGVELSKPEQQFMDRAERLMPYVKPRLSSQKHEHSADKGLIDILNAIQDGN